MQWVARVGELYELHRTRRLLMGDTSAAAFIDAHAKLREHVAQLQRQCDSELADPQLGAPAHKELRVMKSNWPGLVVFVEHPASRCCGCMPTG